MTPYRPTFHLIESRNHEQIKRIRRLQERAERDATGRYYIEGMRCIDRAVGRQIPFEVLVTCPPLLTHPFARRLVREQRRAGTPILAVTPNVLASLALVDDPQGLGAVVPQHWTPLERVLSTESPCWVMVETLRSPGNLGAIVRTAEAVGATGLILLGDAVDPFAPATVRAAIGSLVSQQIVRTNMAEFRRWRTGKPCTLVGTSPAAALDYQAVDFRGPTILVLGDERKGLSPELQALCDVAVQIPMVGGADSLNVSVAAGVLLYEVFNQRRRAYALE